MFELGQVHTFISEARDDMKLQQLAVQRANGGAKDDQGAEKGMFMLFASIVLLAGVILAIRCRIGQSGPTTPSLLTD